MRSTLYIVIQSLGGWWIDKEGKAYGPYSSQTEALAAAPRFIELMGDETQRNQLCATDETGKFQVVWTSAEILN